MERVPAQAARVVVDPWQQGGVLVVLGDGRVTLRHASEGPGDHARAERIRAAPPADGRTPRLP